MASPEARSHSRALQSEEAVTRYAPSTEKTQSQTHRWWPASRQLASAHMIKATLVILYVQRMKFMPCIDTQKQLQRGLRR